MLKLFVLVATINGNAYIVDHGLTRQDCETARLIVGEYEVMPNDWRELSPASLTCEYDLGTKG